MGKKTETKTEAKNDKAAGAAGDKAKAKPPQPPKPKYGVPELAQALGVKPSSVRVRLRNAGIEKSGKLYGWDSKAEMQEVINKLKESGRKSKKAEEADDDGDEGDGDDEE